MYGSEKDQFVSIVIFHFRMEFAQWKSCENGTTQWNFVRWLARRRTAYGNVTATLTLSTFILLTLRVYEIISACTNVCLTLLAYRSTLTAVGYTPSELLLNRTLRTTVPTSRDQTLPTVSDYTEAAERDRVEKQRQAKNYNQRHAAKELPVLLPGSSVYVPDTRVQSENCESNCHKVVPCTDR